MITRPSVDDVLEGIIISLQRDILPEIQSDRGRVIVQVMQALLQFVRQRVPVEQQIMAEEHNTMTALLRQLPDIVGEAAGPAADRIRARAATLGARPDLPALPPADELAAAYRQLSEALVETIDDLYELQAAGHPGAAPAFEAVRTDLAVRAARDFQTYIVGAGMAGRG
ncbi:MAG: hypothetical protein RMK15_02620 [Chloroflexota bacterium]|nr:hypothetical protein [Dehalococcoidia bacterium]MDW8046159.1 hypothetical protein [Chloroflexota bacterium]